MKYRLQDALTAVLAVTLLAAFGCSQQAPVPGGIQSLPFSVVATGDSGVDMRTASTFAWAREQQQTGEDQGHGNVPMDAMLQETIIATLQGKGYRYSAAPGEGDLLVTYRLSLHAAGAGQEPEGTYGNQLQPSLNLASPDPARYEKGTLVIEVTDRLSGRTAWRSALQGFAIPGLGEAERRQRLGLMVDRMLAGVPAK